MCRVARLAVVTEVDHPEAILKGSISDGDDYDNPAHARFVAQPRGSSGDNGGNGGDGGGSGGGTGCGWFPSQSLGRSAGPSPFASEAQALLQLAPRALVNRTGGGTGGGTGVTGGGGGGGDCSGSGGAEFDSFAGVAVVPSRPLLESIFAALGFNGNSRPEKRDFYFANALRVHCPF